jgi:sugar phosphate isomerase/epimerase
MGIEFISVFGLPPVEFVNLAADLGCPHIGMALDPIDFNPQGYPRWSLRNDPALRRATVAAMAERGVEISLGEGLVVMPDRDVRDYAADVEAMADLRVKRLNTLSFDPDLDRAKAQFQALAEMAAGAGMEMCLEFTPSKRIATFSDALDMVRRIDRPNVRILVDTMHFGRSGSNLEALAANPDVVGYVQLCDAPLAPKFDTYVEEAFYERTPVGAGELALADMLAALPADRIVSLELPMRTQALAGLGPRERLAPSVEAARRLLAQVDGS